MNIIQAFVLGMVQGLGEFLPISSSAHLIIVPWFFHWKDPGLSFDVSLHWGTLAAVLAYFRYDIFLMIHGFWRSLFKSTRDLQHDIHQRLAWFLVLGSIPGSVAGKLLDEKAETIFRSPLIIAATVGGFGLILLAADRLGKRSKILDHMGWLDAFLIGCSQAIAIIPGISRSGSTIAAGLGLGYRREDAARFSFLMSIPIILGAGLAKIGHFHTGVGYQVLTVGFIASALFGFFSIKFVMRFVSRHDFTPFVFYRLFLAGMILVIFLIRR